MAGYEFHSAGGAVFKDVGNAGANLVLRGGGWGGETCQAAAAAAGGCGVDPQVPLASWASQMEVPFHACTTEARRNPAAPPPSPAAASNAAWPGEDLRYSGSTAWSFRLNATHCRGFKPAGPGSDGAQSITPTLTLELTAARRRPAHAPAELELELERVVLYSVAVEGCQVRAGGMGLGAVTAPLTPGDRHVVFMVHNEADAHGAGPVGALDAKRQRPVVLVDNEVLHDEAETTLVDQSGVDWGDLQLCVRKSRGASVRHLLLFAKDLSWEELQVIPSMDAFDDQDADVQS